MLYKGMILVLGGELPPNHTFPENEGYDAANDRCTALAPMPAGRHGFGGGVIGPNAYFVGGRLSPGGCRRTWSCITLRLPLTASPLCHAALTRSPLPCQCARRC